jgi:diaminopimelate epimerase
MRVKFDKYHALWNDFIVVDPSTRISHRRLPDLTRAICNRRTGIGADGLLWVSSSRKADRKLDIYNADGGWAEKSGNGLRIAGVHTLKSFRSRKELTFETGSSIDRVRIGRALRGGYQVRTELGEPTFEASRVPVKTKSRFVINCPVKIGDTEFPMTCVAVGNPHAVLVVEDFEFDWKTLGGDIETAQVFPNGTNVEFVRPLTRSRLRLAEWERGVGATGSSGTGAAAAVCAMVTLGLAERRCTVEFEAGALEVDWREKDNIIELSGPVQFVGCGEFDFR